MVDSGTMLSRYRVVRRIGAGGMAEVFLAQVTGPAGFSLPVAIKTIGAVGASPESVSLFLDEARVASALQHAGIVQTLDLGFENDTLFIVMEYVPGPPLSRVIHELLERGRTLAPHLAAHIGGKIAGALDYAHRRGHAANGQPLHLVHRDISPQNILIARTGSVKLTDFGVARASIQTHRTRTGQVRGKAAYMAPEQVRAEVLDGRTDMFALGLVLYEALTGVRPYQRKSDINSMRAIISEDVPPVTEENPRVPAELAQIIGKMLRRAANERYGHCGEVEEAMLAFLRGTHAHAPEEDLRQLLLELFGEEQWSDSLPEVEAWQPTLASAETPVTPKFRFGAMSPEIAALIGQTPTAPRASADPPREPTAFEAARTASLPEQPGLPDTPVPGPDPVAPTHTERAPEATGPVPATPIQSASSTTGVLSGSVPEQRAVVENLGARRFRQVSFAAFVLLAVLAGLVYERRRERQEVHSSPLTMPAPANGPAAVPGTAPPEPEPEPREAQARPRRPVPVEPEGREPTPTTRERRPRRPVLEVGESPQTPPKPPPALDRKALLLRAVVLKQALAPREGALAKEIDRLAIDLQLREPRPEDVALLERAERSIRR